jgi:Protein of unknown function (DUF3105)
MAKHQNRGKNSAVRDRGRRLKLGATLAGVLVVAGAIGWFTYRAAADLPGERFPDLGNDHIQTVADRHVAYNSEPPTSGPHLPYIAPWGLHTRPVPPELQVHNLEDGGVMVQYNCTCPELVDKLGAVVSRYDKYVILAPYPGMKSRIALTAWTRLDRLEEFDEKRIVRFIDFYRGLDHHKR